MSKRNYKDRDILYKWLKYEVELEEYNLTFNLFNTPREKKPISFTIFYKTILKYRRDTHKISKKNYTRLMVFNYRLAHKKHLQVKQKGWDETHRTQCKQRYRDYNRKHKAERDAYSKKYYDCHRTSILIQKREYKKKRAKILKNLNHSRKYYWEHREELLKAAHMKRLEHCPKLGVPYLSTWFLRCDVMERLEQRLKHMTG